MMRIIDIIEGTSVDGPGLRTSLYFAGCEHHCKGCQNPQTWSSTAGKDWSVEDVLNIIEYNKFNVTFSGGDPMFQAKEILPLAKELHNRGYNIWCYTGYTFEQICDKSPYKELLEHIDVLVDGRFVEELYVPNLRWKGSTNQRVIDVQKSLSAGNAVLFE